MYRISQSSARRGGGPSASGPTTVPPPPASPPLERKPAERLHGDLPGEMVLPRALGLVLLRPNAPTGSPSWRPTRCASSKVVFSLMNARPWAARPTPLRSTVPVNAAATFWSKVAAAAADRSRSRHTGGRSPARPRPGRPGSAGLPLRHRTAPHRAPLPRRRTPASGTTAAAAAAAAAGGFRHACDGPGGRSAGRSRPVPSGSDDEGPRPASGRSGADRTPSARDAHTARRALTPLPRSSCSAKFSQRSPQSRAARAMSA